jgi:cytosine/creatinine deaminase
MTTASESRQPSRLLRSARLSDGRDVDVLLADGTIAAVGPCGTLSAEGHLVDDLTGFMLLPAMAEPHAHLDKALTADIAPNAAGDLMGAIEAWHNADAAGRFTYGDCVRRTTAALEKLLLNGVTAVRTHVNIGADAGFDHLGAVQEAARAFDGLLDVQTVALVHFPVVGTAGAENRKALARAIEDGVHLVGGCPHLEDDGPGSIEVFLDAATEAGIGVDLHTDESLNPSALTLLDLARAVTRRGFQHPVAASHCVSLSMQPLATQESVAAEVAAAGIAIVALPQTNLFLQGRGHHLGMPRAITPVRVLQDAGVLVAAGGDNVQDPFNPVGRSDPLETAGLMIMATHLLPDNAYGTVSNDVRSLMGFPAVRVAPGDPADLVAVAAPSLRGAIADGPADRRVYRSGRLVASTTSAATIHR